MDGLDPCKMIQKNTVFRAWLMTQSSLPYHQDRPRATAPRTRAQMLIDVLYRARSHCLYPLSVWHPQSPQSSPVYVVLTIDEACIFRSGPLTEQEEH
eukprot:scaffold44090_cov60-Attheya_sp.AAC.1